MSNKMKIVLKGAYLPTIGGISIHIERLAQLLSESDELCKVYSITPLKGYVEKKFIVQDVSYNKLRYDVIQSLVWLFRHGIWEKSSIIHIHGNPIWESPTILLLLVIKKKIIYTIHDQMILSDSPKYPKLFMGLFRKILLNKNIRWITVNAKIRDQFTALFPKIENIYIIPAYIPSEHDNNPLDIEIEEFMSKNAKTLTVYAHSVRLYEGKDLYGVDLAIKALRVIRQRNIDVGLIICLSNQSEIKHLKDYYDLVEDFELTENVLFFLKPVNNPINLWKKSDIVLRPTLTDGDSLVVREAIGQGTPVIASDVVLRPKGTILFTNGNYEDLAEKIINVIITYPEKIETEKQSDDNYKLIKEVYNSVI